MTKRKEKEDYWNNLINKIESKGQKKIKAGKENDKESFMWLRIFGVIGWSVVVPLLLGIAAGLWLDKTFPSRFSFTLMLMTAGLILGCYNAWKWLKKFLDNND